MEQIDDHREYEADQCEDGDEDDDSCDTMRGEEAGALQKMTGIGDGKEGGKEAEEDDRPVGDAIQESVVAGDLRKRCPGHHGCRCGEKGEQRRG